jgi:hypothetical protein
MPPSADSRGPNGVAMRARSGAKACPRQVLLLWVSSRGSSSGRARASCMAIASAPCSAGKDNNGSHTQIEERGLLCAAKCPLSRWQNGRAVPRP